MTDAEIIDWVIRKIKSGSSEQRYYSARGKEWVPRSIDQPDANEMGKLRLFLRTHGVASSKELLKCLAAGQNKRTSEGYRFEEPVSPLGRRYQNKYYGVYKFLKHYLADLPGDEDDAKRALWWLVKLLAVKKEHLDLIGGNWDG